jgi:hypothetical protein
MDSKADRKQKILLVHNLHFERVKLTKAEIGKIAGAVVDFARFNQCGEVLIKKSNSRRYLKWLKEVVKMR